MGAGVAIRAAAAYPRPHHRRRRLSRRYALATDAPDSPHLLRTPKITAKVLVADAGADAGFPARAGRPPPRGADHNQASTTRSRSISDARHGYTMPDLPVYNPAAAERHWSEMLSLFDETLKVAA